MKITLLGTGNAVAGKDRENTYLLLEHKEQAMMVDVGGNPLRRLKQLDVSQDKIDVVFFTHFHIDHIYGLPSLLWGMWLEERKKPLTIYCSQGDKERLHQYLAFMDVKEWPIQFEIRIETYDAEQPTPIPWSSEVQVRTIPALHSAPTAGLELRLGERLAVYSADTMINSYIQRYEFIDLLIHEATSASEPLTNHSSLAEVLQAYEVERKVGEFVAVHLSDGQPYEQVLQALSAEVQKKCIIGHDLMELSLKQ